MPVERWMTRHHQPRDGIVAVALQTRLTISEEAKTHTHRRTYAHTAPNFILSSFLKGRHIISRPSSRLVRPFPSRPDTQASILLSFPFLSFFLFIFITRLCITALAAHIIVSVRRTHADSQAASSYLLIAWPGIGCKQWCTHYTFFKWNA